MINQDDEPLCLPLLEALSKLRGLPLLPAYRTRDVAALFGVSPRAIGDRVDAQNHTKPREARKSAPNRTISREKLETLEDLLRAIRGSEPEGSHLVKTLGTTAGHLMDYLGEPPDKISIRRLVRQAGPESLLEGAQVQTQLDPVVLQLRPDPPSTDPTTRLG